MRQGESRYSSSFFLFPSLLPAVLLHSKISFSFFLEPKKEKKERRVQLERTSMSSVNPFLVVLKEASLPGRGWEHRCCRGVYVHLRHFIPSQLFSSLFFSVSLHFPGPFFASFSLLPLVSSYLLPSLFLSFFLLFPPSFLSLAFFFYVFAESSSCSSLLPSSRETDKKERKRNSWTNKRLVFFPSSRDLFFSKRSTFSVVSSKKERMLQNETTVVMKKGRKTSRGVDYSRSL